MKEYVFSLNDFKMPKVFDENDTNYIHIIRLLLLEPGTFQSHPTMGVGIKSKYRFNNDENLLGLLKSDIRNQMIKYLPWLVSTEVTLTRKGNILGIVINTDEGAYVVAYNTVDNTTEAAASYVLDNL